MPDIKTTLAELAKQIDATLNPPAATAMTAEEFTTYAQEQLAKAQGETGPALKARAEALKAAVEKAQATFAEGTEKVDFVKFIDPAIEQAPAVTVAAETVATPEPVAPVVPAAEVAKGEPVYWPSDLNDPAFRANLQAK